MVCFSESFESLSEGLQQALQKLDRVPEAHVHFFALTQLCRKDTEKRNDPIAKARRKCL